MPEAWTVTVTEWAELCGTGTNLRICRPVGQIHVFLSSTFLLSVRLTGIRLRGLPWSQAGVCAGMTLKIEGIKASPVVPKLPLKIFIEKRDKKTGQCMLFCTGTESGVASSVMSAGHNSPRNYPLLPTICPPRYIQAIMEARKHLGRDYMQLLYVVIFIVC